MMMSRSLAVVLVVAALSSSGCSTVRRIVGAPDTGDPSVLRAAETRWLLVQNPRFGDVPSEPEYIWVEEDKVPTTLKTLVRGKSSIIAPPEIVARYGSPPGGGRISPRQGVPYQPAATTGSSSSAAVPNGRPGAAPARAPASGPAVELPRRGYVVHVDTTRIAVDLTSADGLRPGSLVSVRRDKTPIVHPVTGEVLGELDEEVATAKIVETRDKFSLAEIQSVLPGSRIQVKDRVVAK
jgi:hypothetical protein